jgi:hypothetical protein
VSEVVERNIIVVMVDADEEVSQNINLNVEFLGEVEVEVHLLEENQHLLILPLPVVEGRLSEELTSLGGQNHVAGNKNTLTFIVELLKRQSQNIHIFCVNKTFK